jgi:hypothetical protein
LGAAVAVMDTTLEGTNDLDLAWLLAAFLAGPAGWALTQGVGYAIVKPACAGGSPFLLGLIAFVGLVVSGAGAWLAWRRSSSLRAVAVDSGGREIDRSYFLAVIAAGLNTLIALLILTTLTSQLWSRCE